MQDGSADNPPPGQDCRVNDAEAAAHTVPKAQGTATWCWEACPHRPAHCEGACCWQPQSRRLSCACRRAAAQEQEGGRQLTQGRPATHGCCLGGWSYCWREDGGSGTGGACVSGLGEQLPGSSLMGGCGRGQHSGERGLLCDASWRSTPPKLSLLLAIDRLPLLPAGLRSGTSRQRGTRCMPPPLGFKLCIVVLPPWRSKLPAAGAAAAAAAASCLAAAMAAAAGFCSTAAGAGMAARWSLSGGRADARRWYAKAVARAAAAAAAAATPQALGRSQAGVAVLSATTFVPTKRMALSSAPSTPVIAAGTYKASGGAARRRSSAAAP